MDISPDGKWIVAVCERPHADREHENLLVLLPAEGGDVLPLAAGHDFYASPRFSPDGGELAFITWDHPAMPWDGTTLWTMELRDGRGGEPRRVAGGAAESVLEPAWSPGGVLTFASDRSGWWNLYQRRGPRTVEVAPAEAEFSRPPWALGQSHYGFVDEHRIAAAITERGRDRLVVVDARRGSMEEVATDFVAIDGVRVQGATVAIVGAAEDRAATLETLEVESGRRTLVARSLALELAAEGVSRPETIAFPGEGGAITYGFFYAPQSARCSGPPGELPPLLVQCHGGPTASATPALRLMTQFWTSRGLAVVDVNYGGSTGLGRAYRERLRRGWGVVDLADCCNAARYLVEQRRVDGRRLAIRGGSAGGYTVLCAATFAELFAVGVSYYGIADLKSMARHTHKFESRYLDSLVGKLPEEEALYDARSPIHHVDRLRTPLLVLQGLEDKVVPAEQAQMMVAALERRAITHAYLAFPEEAHGFRRASSIERALLAELAFYAHVFGFHAEGEPVVEIRHPR
jgi:dipeptidyl aminopeptidase/acylaminoacyl peptidase